MRRDFATWVASCPASPVPRFRLTGEDATNGVAEGHFAPEWPACPHREH